MKETESAAAAPAAASAVITRAECASALDSAKPAAVDARSLSTNVAEKSLTPTPTPKSAAAAVAPTAATPAPPAAARASREVHAKLEARLAQIETESVKLRADCARSEAEISQLRADRDRSEAESATLRTERVRSLKESGDLREELLNARQQLAAAAEASATAAAAVAPPAEIADGVPRHELTKLEARLAQSERETAQARGDLLGVRQQLAAADDKAERERAALRDDLRAAQSALLAVRRQLVAAEAQAATAQADAAAAAAAARPAAAAPAAAARAAEARAFTVLVDAAGDVRVVPAALGSTVTIDAPPSPVVPRVSPVAERRSSLERAAAVGLPPTPSPPRAPARSPIAARTPIIHEDDLIATFRKDVRRDMNERFARWKTRFTQD